MTTNGPADDEVGEGREGREEGDRRWTIAKSCLRLKVLTSTQKGVKCSIKQVVGAG